MFYGALRKYLKHCLPVLMAGAGMLCAGASADEDAMEILRVEPDEAVASTRPTVELRGTGFPASPRVFFGDEAAKVLLSEVEGPIDRILAVAPLSGFAEAVDVMVMDRDNPERQAVRPGGFRYTTSIVVLPVLSGTVSEAGTGQAVMGARVRVTPGKMTAIAGQLGEYAVVLPGPGTYTVRAYAMGYEDTLHLAEVGPSAVHRVFNIDLTPLAASPADSDGDGLSDEEEVQHGANPASPDTDTDGFSDSQELALGLDPLNFFDGDLYRRTDVDLSGETDAADLQLVINVILGMDDLEAEDADVTNDGSVNAADLQWVVRALLGGGSGGSG
jgi:hypothetical protein